MRQDRGFKEAIQNIELEAKLPTLFKLGEYSNLWSLEATPEVRRAEVAKRLEGSRGHGLLPRQSGPDEVNRSRLTLVMERARHAAYRPGRPWP